ncbi:MAG: isoaspartyl peptidase/L-asparaginase [Verrucomicrobiota bacterium]
MIPRQFFLLLSVTCLWISPVKADDFEPGRYAILLHGGAGSSADSFGDAFNLARRETMAKALKAGTDRLKKGESSLDVVEAVVRILEDDPQFNAGKGSVYTDQGKCELDASIMDGRTLACGAVAGVTRIKNPITLARRVMTETRHVLLSGPGADQFGEEMKVARVANAYFKTRRQTKAWDGWKKRQARKSPDSKGTVGCVALDQQGNLAAATSTGGMMGKKFGRVGDSPIIAAGTYADNETCAVSCTGVGEEYIRNAIAFDVSARMKYANISLEEAVTTIIENVLKKGEGGIIAVDRKGNLVSRFNTGGMAYAEANSDGKFEVHWGRKTPRG